MNLAHVHLLVNHLPVFITIAGILVLLYGMFTKNEGTKMAAFMLFIISTLGAIAANYTGEPAEEAVEKLAGVSHQFIEEHEELAESTVPVFILLGLVSILGLFTRVRLKRFSNTIGILILLVSLAGMALVARTAFVGGKIRHSEVRTASEQQAAAQPEAEGEEDDE